MKKEEILSKSRKEKKDEYYEYIINKSLKYYMLINISVCIFIAFFNQFIGKGWYEIFGIMFLGNAFTAYCNYIYTRKKEQLIFFIISILISVGYICLYVYSELKLL